MKVITRYFPVKAVFKLPLPKDTQILQVGIEDKQPFLHAMHDLDGELESEIQEREFRAFCSGERIPKDLIKRMKYIGSYSYPDTIRATAKHWHVFEILG